MENGTKDRMLRLLREIAEMSGEASLTGNLTDGAPQAVQRYNAILRHFLEHAEVPAGLFEPLPESASFGRLGVESRMLASYFEPDHESDKGKKGKSDASVLIRLAPFVDSADLAELVKEYVQDGVSLDPGVLTGLAPFMKSTDLGILIRKHLSKGPHAPEPPTARPEQPQRPAEPSAPAPVAAIRDLAPAPDRSPVRPTLDDLSAQLRRPDLTQEERQTIAIQLAEIAHEQARFSE